MPARTVAELAAICKGELEGDAELVITGANALETANKTELSFVANSKAVTLARSSRAGCLLVPEDFGENGAWARIRVANPRVAFVRALATLYPQPNYQSGIHPTASVAASARIPESVTVGPFVTIGEQTVIGEGCVIGTHCSIGNSVRIGDRTVVRPQVTLYDDVRIGARVVLQSGCVIGADGFGFALVEDHY